MSSRIQRHLALLLSASQILASTGAYAAAYEVRRPVPKLVVTAPAVPVPGEDPAPQPGSAQLQTSTQSLVFDNVAVNSTSDVQTVLVFNTGTASGTVNSVQVSGAGASLFTATTNCSSALPAGTGSCHVSVTFKPTSTTPASATLTISTTSGDLSVGLTGQGFGSAVMQSSQSSLDFSYVQTGTTSAEQTVQISNQGTVAGSVTSTQLSGADAALFNVTSECSQALAAGSGCAIRVSFSPTQMASASAVLTINTTSGALSVQLSGEGNGPSDYMLSKTTLDFGKLTVNTTSTSQSVSVNNVGQGVGKVTAVTLTGASASQFSIVSTCTLGAWLGFSSCPLSVNFKPTALGTHTATLNVQTSSGLLTATLTGVAQEVPATSSGWSADNWQGGTLTSSSFVNTTVGATRTTTLYLRNTGSSSGALSAAFTLTGDTTHFKMMVAPVLQSQDSVGNTLSCSSMLAVDGLSASECTAQSDSLGEYQHIKVVVQFQPQAPGSYAVQLTPTSSNGSSLPSAITFTGTGEAALTAGFVQYNGKTYSKPDGVNRTWSTADSYCSAATFMGYSDWRLPTLTEMEAVRINKVALDLQGKGWPMTSWYWTSLAGGSGHAAVTMSSNNASSREGSTYSYLSDVNVRTVTCVR